MGCLNMPDKIVIGYMSGGLFFCTLCAFFMSKEQRKVATRVYKDEDYIDGAYLFCSVCGAPSFDLGEEEGEED